MPNAAIPLSRLAKHLAKGQSELDRLRKRYETRLAAIQQRRGSLQAQLDQVEAEIRTVGHDDSAPADEETAAAPVAKTGRRGKKVKLPGLIVSLIESAGKPLTVKELAGEIQRKKIPTKSMNIPKLVQVRVYEMTRKGVLAHAKGQPGYVVASANGQARSVPAGAKSTAAPKAQTGKTSHRGGPRGSQPPLREVLTKILEGCKEPIGGGELADRARKAGYKSKSKSFRDVVWVNLGNMKNVEHVPGQGYRLKKR
jgi:hypothetical protein